MDFVYYCLVFALIALLSWPLTMSEFHAKGKGFLGWPALGIFFLRRNLPKWVSAAKLLLTRNFRALEIKWLRMQKKLREQLGLFY